MSAPLTSPARGVGVHGGVAAGEAVACPGPARGLPTCSPGQQRHQQQGAVPGRGDGLRLGEVDEAEALPAEAPASGSAGSQPQEPQADAPPPEPAASVICIDCSDDEADEAATSGGPDLKAAVLRLTASTGVSDGLAREALEGSRGDAETSLDDWVSQAEIWLCKHVALQDETRELRQTMEESLQEAEDRNIPLEQQTDEDLKEKFRASPLLQQAGWWHHDSVRSVLIKFLTTEASYIKWYSVRPFFQEFAEEMMSALASLPSSPPDRSKGKRRMPAGGGGSAKKAKASPENQKAEPSPTPESSVAGTSAGQSSSHGIRDTPLDEHQAQLVCQGMTDKMNSIGQAFGHCQPGQGVPQLFAGYQTMETVDLLDEDDE